MMTKHWKIALGLPALVVVSGLIAGCGASAPDTGTPTPKPSTPEDQKKAAASVEAGRAGMMAPGVAGAKKYK